MQVPLGDDYTLAQLHLALGAHQLTCAGALHMAALADGSRDAQSGGVGGGDLHLVSLTHRPQNGHIGHFLLGPHDGQPLIAGILAGIGQGLADSQLIALAEQLLHRLLGQVDVAGRRFDHERHCFFLLFVRKNISNPCRSTIQTEPAGGLVPFRHIQLILPHSAPSCKEKPPFSSISASNSSSGGT